MTVVHSETHMKFLNMTVGLGLSFL